MPDEKQIEFLLQISVLATDLKDACNKVTGGSVISGSPMPKAPTQVPRPPLLPVQEQPATKQPPSK